MFFYLICCALAAALFAADQWSKAWVTAHMTLGETAPLWGDLLELNCVHNYGVAWSMFSGMRWLLIGVTGTIVLAVALAIVLRLIQHPLGIIAAFLILSGGLGNLVDRIVRGYVVDMIHLVFWPTYPTFNVADMCIVSGCVLWIIYALAIHEPSEGGRRTGRRRRARTPRRERHGASSVRTSADDDFDADFKWTPTTSEDGDDTPWNS